MKPIKCPNCGKNMYRGISGLFGKMWASRMCCTSCGVEGPRGNAPTAEGSWRVAARLTREWIARMEADKRDAERYRQMQIAYVNHGVTP